MNFWRLLRGSQDPKKLFLDFDPQKAAYLSVSWNFDLKEPSQRLWQIEVQGEKEEIIEWHGGKSLELRFFRDQKLLASMKPKSLEEKDLMNIALHSAVKEGLTRHQEFMLAPVSGATTMDYQNEQRALQWIQASLGTLTRVLNKMKADPSLILTAAFFSGKQPDSEDTILRLIIFNLDLILTLKSDSTLQIVVFDDKNQGHGSSNAPTFQQIIKVTKPQIYDEIMKLVHQIATAGELV